MKTNLSECGKYGEQLTRVMSYSTTRDYLLDELAASNSTDVSVSSGFVVRQPCIPLSIRSIRTLFLTANSPSLRCKQLLMMQFDDTLTLQCIQRQNSQWLDIDDTELIL